MSPPPQLEAASDGDRRYYHRPFNFSFIWNLQHGPRRRMYDHFMRRLAPTERDRILDLGATNIPEPLENFFEHYYPHPHRITAAGIEDCHFLEQRYAGLRFVKLEPGKPLPFSTNEFDVGFSNATLEHVGSRENQAQFLKEMLRVCRKIYVTTPNRWYPFELHTRLPFLHWLPPRWFRRLLKALGYDFYAEEINLNLLGASDLRALIPRDATNVRIDKNYFFGFPSNLLLSAEKPRHP